MKQQSYTNTISVDQLPEQVFEAINNPRVWWCENISGVSDRLGATFHYAYRGVHTCEILVEALTPYTAVVWHVVDSHFGLLPNDSEWKDTRIVFDIARRGDKTVLTFTHVGLVPDCHCFELCQRAWRLFTGDSLYRLITTGKGDPVELSEALIPSTPQLKHRRVIRPAAVSQRQRGKWKGQIAAGEGGLGPCIWRSTPND